MTVLGKLKVATQLDPATRRVVWPAFAWVIYADLSNRILPFRAIAKWLGTPCSPEAVTQDKSRLDEALRIGRAVDLAARNLPWPVLCLPRAIAVKRMLRARGITATVYFGQRPSDTAATAFGDAHAWVAIDNRVLIGGPECASYRVVAAFE